MDVLQTATNREVNVLQAAAVEARRVGLAFITRDGVADRAGIPRGSMCLFGSMTDIRNKVASMCPDLDDGANRNRYQAARSETDQRILDAALELAALGRYDKLTRREIADAASVSPGRVSLLAGDMDGIRDAIMKAAVAGGNAAVVAQGLVDQHPAALAAPEDLKTEALATLSTGAQ